MSLIRRSVPAQSYTLITLREAAEMLRLDESTVRKGLAGTDVLTKVRLGTGKRQRIRLVREEIEAYIAEMVEHAREKNGRALKLVYGT